MLYHGRLEKLWQDHPSRWLIQRHLTITEEGVVLGADTVIAKAVPTMPGRARLEIDGCEERILALLSVAYWRPMPAGIIEKFHAASRALARGETTLALIHLAHTGLQCLEEYGAEQQQLTKRLFLADLLIEDGMEPAELLKGLDLLPQGTTALQWRKLAKYSPDQPRDYHGRWTDGGGPAPPPMVQGELSPPCRRTQLGWRQIVLPSIPRCQVRH